MTYNCINCGKRSERDTIAGMGEFGEIRVCKDCGCIVEPQELVEDLLEAIEAWEREARERIV